MKKRVAIVEGVRTPFCKAGGALRDYEADDLGAFAVQELLARSGIDGNIVDELIFGNVLQPLHATNIARILAIKGGLPQHVPAFTVNRNCASGLEAIVTGATKILHGEARIIIAGGTEAMSNFPLLFSKKMKDYLVKLSKAKTWQQKLQTMLGFRPSMLKPVMPEISDPLCSLTMGQTAENLSRDFRVTRREQDEFALRSQQRSVDATANGKLPEEIVPVPIPPSCSTMQLVDEGPRANQTLDVLLKLRPVFDPLTGSVTAGNASPLTDGAAALLLMDEDKARELGYKPLGYIVGYASAGLDPSRMGLGPVFATAKLLEKTGLSLKDFDLIEINEAFAAQVLAVLKAFQSTEFARDKLGRDKALGEIDQSRLNVNGGAVALGHPLGASGARLVLTILKELNRRKGHFGLATLCIGGGQGEAIALEVES